MGQEFYVLRCFSCSTFQTQIVKKVKKWECRMCGEKQSVIKVYGQGTAKDCRIHTQKLNEMRIIEEEKPLGLVNIKVNDPSQQKFPANDASSIHTYKYKSTSNEECHDKKKAKLKPLSDQDVFGNSGNCKINNESSELNNFYGVEDSYNQNISCSKPISKTRVNKWNMYTDISKEIKSDDEISNKNERKLFNDNVVNTKSRIIQYELRNDNKLKDQNKRLCPTQDLSEIFEIKTQKLNEVELPLSSSYSKSIQLEPNLNSNNSSNMNLYDSKTGSKLNVQTSNLKNQNVCEENGYHMLNIKVEERSGSKFVARKTAISGKWSKYLQEEKLESENNYPDPETFLNDDDVNTSVHVLGEKNDGCNFLKSVEKELSDSNLNEIEMINDVDKDCDIKKGLIFEQSDDYDELIIEF